PSCSPTSAPFYASTISHLPHPHSFPTDALPISPNSGNRSETATQPLTSACRNTGLDIRLPSQKASNSHINTCNSSPLKFVFISIVFISIQLLVNKFLCYGKLRNR